MTSSQRETPMPKHILGKLNLTLLLTMASFYVMATDLIQDKGITKVQVVYVESLPTGEEDNPLLRALRQTEPIQEDEKIAESILMTDNSRQNALKLIASGGFADMPLPLLKHTTLALKSKGISAIPVFRSHARPKDEVEQIANTIRDELGVVEAGGRGKSPHTLIITPYRISYNTNTVANLKIGAALYDEIAKKWVWSHHFSISFLGKAKLIGDAEMEKLSSLLISVIKGPGSQFT